MVKVTHSERMPSESFSSFTYHGKPLPTPPASLDGVKDELLITAWVVDYLIDADIPKVRELLLYREVRIAFIPTYPCNIIN